MIAHRPGLGPSTGLPSVLARTHEGAGRRPPEQPAAHGRLRYLADVDLVATAVENVCSDRDQGYRRVNVEILGNRDPILHAHIWPRYDWVPAEMVDKPVWLYPPGRWQEVETALGPQHGELRPALVQEVERLRDAPEFRLDG